MKSTIRRVVVAITLAISVFCARPGLAAGTISAACIDPVFGASASAGARSVKISEIRFKPVSAKGGAPGHPIDLALFDGKPRLSEAPIALRTVTGQTIPYVMRSAC